MSKKSARRTAFDQSAPPAERFDAQAELTKAHTDLSGLLPAEQVRPVIDYIMSDLRDQEMMAKAGGVVVPFPSKNAGKKGVQSVVLDDLQIAIMGDYIERPGMLDFHSLRAMVDQTPVLSAVLLTRVRQVQAFCKRQESGHGAGFVIRHADVAHELKDDERQTIELLQRFFVNCGWEFNPRARKRLGRQSLRQMMAMSVRDSLAMDSAPIETEFKRDRSLGIDGFYAVDGASIRLCTEDGYKGDDEIFALQVVQGQIRTAYDYNGLIYEPRNPRSDVTSAGYGLSETELLIKVVTGFLNAMTLNIKGFSDNAIPKGVLHLTGNYDQADLQAFKRYWNGMVKGVNNAWAVPVMVSKDQESKASFENFGVEFNEMMFSKWMTFLTSIICAVYGMSPSEINFDSFTGGGTSPLSGSDTSERLAFSKDSGLRPLLSYYENLFSDYILAEFGDSYVFRWTGVDEDDQDKRHEMKKMTMSVNEMRAELGLEKQAASWGEAPLNPSLVGPWTQEQQAANQPGPDYGGGDGGQPGQDCPGGADGQDPGQPSQQGGSGAPVPAQAGTNPAGSPAEDPGADPGEDKPPKEKLQKANDSHDEIGRFAPRTHQIRLEKRSLHELYDFTLKYPIAAPDSMLAHLSLDDLSVQVDHGPAVESANGGVKVTGGKYPGKGYGMVKIIWRHGERSGKQPDMRVTRGDVLALPDILRTTPTSIALDSHDQPVRWEWKRERFDGQTVVYAASRFAAGDNKNHIVSIHVGTGSEMRKAAMFAAGDLFGLTPQLPGSELPIASESGGPLTVHYAEDDQLVKAAPVRLHDAAKEIDPTAMAAERGIGLDDHVFARHAKHGVMSGKVLAYGRDGFLVEHPEAGKVGVPWDGYLGHKSRPERKLSVVEKGEAGSIVQDEAGRRHYLAGNVEGMTGEDPELDAERALILGQDQPESKE